MRLVTRILCIGAALALVVLAALKLIHPTHTVAPHVLTEEEIH